MSKTFDPQIVVTKREVLFSWIVADQLERIRVPRELLDQAQGRPFRDGEAWALVESRISEIGAAHAAGGDKLDWLELLGPRNH